MSESIVVCMGSSCFGRGNSTVVETLTKFVEEHNLGDKIEVSGSLCMSETGGSAGICMKGPNMKINGKLIHGVTVESLPGIITRELGLQL